MEYIAEDPNLRAWHFQFVEALDMMNKKFANPYIIYYPVVSRDGMPFPANRTVRDIQEEVNKGRRLREDQLWRGNLVTAKFADDHFTQMIEREGGQLITPTFQQQHQLASRLKLVEV